MVFIDTDVLSIFAKIQRLPLLFTVFGENLNGQGLDLAIQAKQEIVSVSRLPDYCKIRGKSHSDHGLVDVASRDRLPFRVPQQEEVAKQKHTRREPESDFHDWRQT